MIGKWAEYFEAVFLFTWLTSALRLRGFSSDIRGLLYIGLADGAKTAWKGFIFGCVAVLWLG